MALRLDATAVVTGASGSIGGAVALALAARGLRLLLAGRDPQRLEATAERARKLAPEVLTHLGDLTCDRGVADLVAHAGEAFPGVDALVHGAGSFVMGAVESAPVSELDLLWRTNVRGPLLLTQGLLPTLRARKGQVVFLNSSVVRGPRVRVGAYAATKTALLAVADSLRDEVNGDGVRVLSVFPGRTAGPLQEEIHRSEGRPYDPSRLLQPADVAEAVVAALLLARSAELTDLHLRPMLKS